MSNDIILEAAHLSKVFGGLVAVDDVSIQIKKQTLHCDHWAKWGRKNHAF